MKLKEKVKRFVVIVIGFVFLLSQTYTMHAMSEVEVVNNEYLTILTTERQYNNGNTYIVGKAFVVNQLTDISDGVLFMLYSHTYEKYNDFSYANTVHSTNENIYSKNNVSFYCDRVSVSKMVVAEKDINMFATEVTSDAGTIIYSKNGNVNIGVDKADFNGIIYAPNGTVTINASTANVNGLIICDKLITNTGTFKSVGNEQCQKLYNVFAEIRNDTLFEMELLVNDEGSYEVTYECNKVLENVDIYIRVDDSDTFEYYMQLPENGVFTVDKNYTNLDIGLYGCTILGEIEKSNVESFNIYQEEVEYFYCDVDEDNLSDAEEIWLTNTNPNSMDTDMDGFSDYYECMVLCTNPTIFNQDIDFEQDGLLNSEEQILGTNPLMADCDFDGILDGTDENPYFYEGTGEIEISDYNVYCGMFDRVITSISEEMKLSQIVYNTMTGETRSYSSGNIGSMVVYDTLYRKCAEIVRVGNESRINLFSYDDNNNLIQIVHNGDVYRYGYMEDGGINHISINGNKILEYDIVTGELSYANMDSYISKYEEQSNEYSLKLNSNTVMKWMNNDCGQIINAIYDISGMEDDYEYYESGYIKSVHSNTEFSSDYVYDDNEIAIEYNDTQSTYKQVSYNIEDNEINVQMISGDLLNKRKENDTVACLINDSETTIMDTEYTFDDDRVTQIEYKDGLTYEYEYNAQKQIAKILKNGEPLYAYEYYDNGQLYKEDIYDDNTTYIYSYDTYNNISKVDVYEGDILVNTKEYEYESNLWNDVLSSFNGSVIEYDEIGNPITYYDDRVFEWSGRELSSVNNDDHNINYGYDTNGIRNYKNVDGKETFYFVEGEDIVAEKTDDNIIWYIYDAQSEIYGFIYNKETYYYDKNATNDVIRIIDASGEIVCQYEYDSWGNVIGVVGNTEIASINPIRYRSYYYDSDVEMYYLRTRFYDSNIGRFINPDNMLRIKCNDMDYNLYAYCGGDPVNLYDPDGQAAKYYVGMFVAYEFQELGSELKSDINGVLKSTSWKYKVASMEDKEGAEQNNELTTWWNGLGKRDLVLIFTHGNPRWLVTGDDMVYGYGQVDKLEKQDVRLLVVLGCNTGHFDYNPSIARAFSNKITGKVVASDGTVLSYGSSSGYTQVWFKSIYNDKYRNLTVGKNIEGPVRANYGWMVYVGTGIGNYGARVYYLSGRGCYELTVGTICNLVTIPTFYNSFK